MEYTISTTFTAIVKGDLIIEANSEEEALRKAKDVILADDINCLEDIKSIIAQKDTILVDTYDNGLTTADYE